MWKVVQCSVRGRGHIDLDMPCQDKTYSTNIDDVYVIALADGAGSAKYSHYGAETVTQYICTELTRKFDDFFEDSNGVSVKKQLIQGVSNCLSKKTTQLTCEMEDLASTLLLVAVKEQKFIIAHIGDGVIGYFNGNELKVASKPENGEFINTTVFTTSKDAIMTMKLIKGNLDAIQGFVLMSDGTETSLYDRKDKKIADAIKRLMQMTIFLPADKIQELLKESFEKVVIKTTIDDCSIAMLVKSNENFSGYMQLSNSQKCEILKIRMNTSKKIIKRYDEILMFLLTEKSISQIASKIKLKRKYVKKYLERLCNLHFIEEKEGRYHTILIMNTGYEKFEM